VLGVFAREPHSECVMDQMTPTHAIAGQCFTPLQIAERVESVSAEPVLTERIFYVTSVGFMACLPTAGKYTRHSVRKIAPQQSSHAKDESAHSFFWLGEKQIKVVLRRENIFLLSRK
jgi:hypothetical protein